MEEDKLTTIEADEDIFEINDFTVVTELEIFIVAIETVLHDNKWLVEGKKTEAIEEKPNFVSKTVSYKM
uniref:Uncharacterized protein n=1 Tax=Ditylenchus dipsaci TaxID=166011 RepID=A0A915DMH3_9BILA